ncbi:MAG TPA: 50S ribosomal protein L3 [bacterium]|nr:50S ribosomal protein L3 [bacterium]HPG83369.1 50S ribosomal protein L3 [bacterium]HPM58828.1 50S ribosomal protein L3 [bacterium]
MRSIIGKKLGMTRVFDEAGNVVAATVIEAGPNVVTQVKTVEKDGYRAVQIGFGTRKPKHVTKAVQGQTRKSGKGPFEVVRELRDFDNGQELQVGDEIKCSIFNPGELVKVTGITKGLGFQGVVRRHHFGGGPKTHGQSDRMRAPGSLGQSSYPSRVFKGLKMAGRMGGVQQTVRNLRVVKVDEANNLLIIKGAVPATDKGIVLIRK